MSGAGGEPLAVLGFRPHTYWTSIVAVGGSPDQPQVLERRRCVFATGHERHCFHQAAEGALEGAMALIERTRTVVQGNAAGEISALLADLQASGLAVRTAVVSAPTSKHPADLAAILASHSYIHAAEGNFYRDVVAGACETVGLTVERAPEKAMPGLVCKRLGIDAEDLDDRMKAMGAKLGAPWNEDYRLATLAAWAKL